jgi:hypothetical protein
MRKLSTRKNRAPASPSLATRLRDVVAIPTLILGGLWAAVQFFYDRIIAPQLEPSLVQMSGSSSVVGRSDCCVLIDFEVKLTNLGKRDTFLHTSQAVVGVKRMEVLSPIPEDSIKTINRSFQRSRAVLSGADSSEMTYGASGPVGSEYLLLALGNLVPPGTQVAPSESVVRHIVVAVPEDFPFVSFRSKVHVLHVAPTEPELDWHWAVKPQNLELQALPWPKELGFSLTELMKCSVSRETQTARECWELVEKHGESYWNRFRLIDRHAYILPWSVDTLAFRTRDQKSLQ